MTKIKRGQALRVLCTALVVIMVTGVLLLVLSVLFYPKNNQQAFGMADENANGVLGERENSLDVLFMGDSEAYSSFSPLQMWADYGFTSYVCGTGLQQLPYTLTLLRRATQKQRPRVVVIETDAIYTPFTVGAAALRTLQDALPIFEYHDRWKSLTPGDLSLSISSTYSDDMKGFFLNKDVKAADATGHMAPSDEVQEIPLINRLYLKHIVEYCRAIGAESVFVSTPSVVCWNTARHNSMAAYARELGVTYLDLNAGPTKIPIDWKSETRDAGDHLNLTGAQKVTAFIGSYLSKTYQLPDHRSDIAFASWNASLERYRQKL